jgi:ankyrin repeat protein
MHSLLESAIASGNLELFEFILDTFSHFVDIRRKDYEVTLLIECLHHREYAMACSLIQRGANLHAEGYSESWEYSFAQQAMHFSLLRLSLNGGNC